MNVLLLAYELLAREPKPDWLSFYREMLGVNGVIRRTFRT